MELERESRLFFDIKYFEEYVSNGDWDEVEKYLSWFTKADDNPESFGIFFEIRRGDRKIMLDIHKRELEVFTLSQADLNRGLVPLFQLHSFRKQEKLSGHGDENSARILLMAKLKQLIEVNPLIGDKLQFPTLQMSRPETLVKLRFSNAILKELIINCPRIFYMRTLTVIKQLTPSPAAHGV